MTVKSFATLLSGPSVYGKLSAVGFLKKYKLNVLHWLWIHLKMERHLIDLLRPLMLIERHLMSRFSIESTGGVDK